MVSRGHCPLFFELGFLGCFESPPPVTPKNTPPPPLHPHPPTPHTPPMSFACKLIFFANFLDDFLNYSTFSLIQRGVPPDLSGTKKTS